MDNIKKFLYYVLHTFTTCPEEDLDNYRDLQATCRKCGRTFFIFKRYL